MPSNNISLDQLGTYHIAQHPELYTPPRSNNFVFIPKITKRLLKAGVDEATASDNDYIKPEWAQEVLMFSVNESAVPHFTQNVIEVKRGNSVVKFAGAVTFNAGSFKFNDFIGAETKTALLALQRLSYNVLNETVGKAEDYKWDGELIEYTPDHRQLRYWEFKGCWISELSEGAYSSDDDGKREITVTIQYDRAIPHQPDDTDNDIEIE